ncbi:hypothetical protein ACEN4P_01355 [Marinilactibacillus psychrotolerans]|uniref:hypothetical protein n=1 Tax=Marinilactibacillus psychrotolerans TaxID=191770 RepID=UPI003889B3B5
MQKRLLFFNVFLCKGNDITNYPVHRFLDDLINLGVSDRFQTIEQTKYKINAVRLDENRTYNREFWFCKYRNDRPFIGDSESDDTDPIDSDVIEPTVFNFIASSHLLVMGYNNYGPSYNILQIYLNRFINNNGLSEDDDNFLHFKVIPVKSVDQMMLIRNAQYISKVDIEYRVSDADYSNLIDGNYRDRPIIADAMEENKRVSELLGSNIGNLVLKKGRFRDPIDMNEALALFANLDLDNDLIRDVKVTVKDEYNKNKNISLKNNGLLYEYITINGNTFDYLRGAIREEYYGRLGQPASNEHVQFIMINENYRNLL